MKVLLTAINAKYIHSNLAVYCLKAYAKEYSEHIEIAEYTINNYEDDILQDIYKRKPDIIAFSCYIWNYNMVLQMAAELKKILPNTKIWMGGPEVSYDSDKCLREHPFLDGIMMGEGEETFCQLMKYYVEGQCSLDEIAGLCYFDENKNVIINSPRVIMELSLVPFPYDNLDAFENKIIYYETSRGCPYSCSYCLSSIDKKVRLRDIELVKKELQLFIDKKIPQIKFVDRTFNCNHKHAMEIWQFIKDNDNGITNFHFEISADLLREDELCLLASLRKGLVQLEIGVQSTNPKTLETIRRKMDFSKLADIVKRINAGENIHQHLDLIAGLPYEDYTSFKNSFNDVYSLKPEQLQLGFLKVLKGSYMYEQAKNYEISYKYLPPYEVLTTKWLSYDDVLKLKGVEEMVEVYYNSGQFTHTIPYLEHFFKTPFDLYEALADYYEEKGLNDRSYARIQRYYILLDFFTDRIGKDEAIKELLLFDLYLRENLKSRPSFAKDFEPYKEAFRNFYNDNENIEKILPHYKGMNFKQLGRQTHIEHFSINLYETIKTGTVVEESNFILFDYGMRNPLNYEAFTSNLNLS